MKIEMVKLLESLIHQKKHWMVHGGLMIRLLPYLRAMPVGLRWLVTVLKLEREFSTVSLTVGKK